MTGIDPDRRTRVIIQSRLSSTRLPGKALLTIAGYPLIELVARRASRSGHEVVVATSEEDYDDLIAETVQRAGLPVFRGSLDDVLGRFAMACVDLEDEDLVVRLTGDNPLMDAGLLDELIEATARSGHTYGRVDVEAAPEGLGAEVFTAAALRAAHEHATEPYDREHVTPWLRRELGEHLHVPQGSPTDIHGHRATVDALNDFVRMSRLFRSVDDPVHAPWQDLIGDLGRMGALGRIRAPRQTPGLHSPSTVFLDAGRISTEPRDRTERARQSAELRGLLAAAVDHGVTDVVLDTSCAAATAAVRDAAFPALAARLSFLVRLSLNESVLEQSTGAELALERTFAVLGRRGCRGIIAADPVLARDTWSTITRYVTEGTAARAGCAAASASALHQVLTLPGLGLVELDLRDGDWTEAVADQLTAAARSGIEIVLRLDGPTVREGPALLNRPWCSAVSVPARSTHELGAVLRSVGG